MKLKKIEEKSLSVDNLDTVLQETLEECIKFSRLNDLSEKPLKVITSEKIKKITDTLQKVNKEIHALYAMRETQFMRKMISTQIIQVATCPLRLLRQLQLEIESRKKDLIDKVLMIKKNIIFLQELKEKIEKEKNAFEKERLKLDFIAILSDLADSVLFLESSFKELGLYCNMYEQIKKNKNIDKVSEADLERDESRYHIKHAFRQAIRDILATGSLNPGTSEYFETLGISPIEADFWVRRYIAESQNRLQQALQTRETKLVPDIEDFHAFLERMADLYENSWKKVAKMMGINLDDYDPDFTLEECE